MRRTPPHGTTARYQRGCKCDRCRAAYAAYHRSYRRRKRAEEKRAQAERLRALRARYFTALELRARGEVDPWEALALVLAPPEGSRLHEARVALTWAPEVREEAIELRRRGWSLDAIARELGTPVGTIKPWLEREGVRANGARPKVTVADLTDARRVAV